MHPNHCEYIFIDESGDLGPQGTKCFTIVALAAHEPMELSRIIKKLRQRKLKKSLKELSEIKAYNSNEIIRRFVLTQLASVHCAISAIVIPKSKIPPKSYDKKEQLYNHLCRLLFEHISINADIVDITIDRKSGNHLLMNDFNEHVNNKIKARRPGIEVRIRHLEAHASTALQVVDFVAWAFKRKFSHDDAQYYDIIKHLVTNAGQELEQRNLF